MRACVRGCARGSAWLDVHACVFTRVQIVLVRVLLVMLCLTSGVLANTQIWSGGARVRALL